MTATTEERPTLPSGDEVWSPKQAAGYFHVSENTTLDWLHQGKLPALQIGRRWFISKHGIDKMLQQAGTVHGQVA